MNHLILGAGPAGIIAAETVRKHAPADAITVVGDEREPPYSRMAIPYLLTGSVDENGTLLRRGTDHFAEQRITLLNGRAASVDTQARVVKLENGSQLPFDRLLIATGSSPATPPIPGIQGPAVHPCWTLADARAIQALAKPGARVVQMGAGFIGCIILEALVSRGVKLTVVEMGDRMVPRMMGPVAGTMIKQWCEGKGITVFTATRVDAIERDATPVLKVRLSNGQKLEADLVISATGVRPNIGFLQDSGILCLQGVLTDEHLQTNVPGIYAAGDCAEAFDKITGRTIVSAIQPNASDQARVAALNMVGKRTELPGVTQINVLDTLGLISASFGKWDGVAGGEHVEVTDTAAGRHLSLQFDGDRLIGCNAIGWTQHVGAMRGLVEGQVRLGPWKDKLLRDPTLLMEAYLACSHRQVGVPLRGWACESQPNRKPMLITFKLYASLTEFLPLDRRKGNAMTLEVPTGATVAEIVAQFALPMKMVHLVLIDGVYVPPEERATRPLAEGETLAIWPPIAGGWTSAMFPPGVAMAFEREYGCTEADWLRDLPAAVAPQALVLEPPSSARVALGPGRLHLRWSKLQPRRIALLNMPRLQVGFRFEAVDAPLRQHFMKRFDLVLQRGGG